MKTKAIFSSFFGVLLTMQMCNSKDIKGSNANSVDSPGAKKVDNSSLPALPNAKNHMDKGSPVTTVTGLRAVSNPATGIKYKTTDFGSGEWVYDPADKTSPDNSGTVIVAGSARFKREFNGPMAVEWFGAKGNGVDDDTKAIQLAVANGTNKTITMKAGATYVISGTLKLPLGCKIEGNNSTIINNIPAGNLSDTYHPRQLFYILNSNCSVSDFVINNKVSNSNPEGKKIGDQTAADICVGQARNDAWIDNTKIINIKISGGIDNTAAMMVAFGEVENVVVKNCIVDGSFSTAYHVEWNDPSGTGVPGIRSPHNITFVNCQAINDSAPTSISFYIAGAYDVTMLNCTATNIKGGIYLSNGDIGVEPGKKVTYNVKNCKVIGFTDYAVTINGSSIKNADWYIGATIDSCKFEGKTAGAGAAGAAIRIYRNGGGISISNCSIDKSVTGITATYSSGTGIKINNNIFDNIYMAAINFVHISNSAISNNQFKNVNTKGHASPFDSTILLQSASNQNTISNNTFGYAGRTTLPYYHIHVVNLPSSADLSVDNNIVNNTFGPTFSKVMILNGDARAGSNQRTHQSGNKLARGFTLVTGAPTL